MRYYEIMRTQVGYKFKRTENLQTSDISLYLIHSADDSYSQGRKIGEGFRNDFEIDLKYNKRPYFYLISKQFQEKIAERTLPVDGMNNFRDMGGYETAENKFVKWGQLYRSDQIYNATTSGLDYLRNLNLKTIIDYRSDDEVEKYPNKKINGDIQTYHLDPNAHAAELSAQFTATKEDEDISLIKALEKKKKEGILISRYDIMIEQYHNFVKQKFSQESFKKMIRIAAKADGSPMDQHCRGGKDRTGFGSMLLLGLLGVPDSDLVYDYMLTYSNRLERNNVKMNIYKGLTDDITILDYLYSLIETKSDFIEESINLINSSYGSILNYCQIVLGISDQEILTLRDKYLE